MFDFCRFWPCWLVQGHASLVPVRRSRVWQQCDAGRDQWAAHRLPRPVLRQGKRALVERVPVESGRYVQSDPIGLAAHRGPKSMNTREVSAWRERAGITDQEDRSITRQAAERLPTLVLE